MNKKWFTLIELIIVMTIIAIVATISFISFTSYLSWVRDSNRISQLNNIRDWVALKINSGDFLMPEWAIEIQNNWDTIAYQGYFWPSLIEKIEYNMEWVDPSTGRYFTYTISADWKYFQLLTFLENESSLTSLWYEKVIVKNNEWLVPYIVWNKEVWVFFDSEMVPIEEKYSSPFNIETGDSDLINVLLRNDRIVSNTWDDIFSNITDVVDNFADNVYWCQAEPYAYADYLINTPTQSNTPWQNSNSDSPCYFKCKTWFTWNWSECEPWAQTLYNVACEWAPSSNFQWNTESSITQNWDETSWQYLPSNQAQYNLSASTYDCRFKCEDNYDYNSSTNECIASTRNEACGILPSWAVWWDWSTITQTWDWSWWTPSFTPWYSSTEELNACKYRCDTNYSWDWFSCVAWWRTESCWTLPTWAIWWDWTWTIVQSWDWSWWTPSFTTWYSSTEQLNACKYTCDTNYSWVWSSCVADTRTESCWTLPTWSTWWDWSTITQTWDWSSWTPSFTTWYSSVNQSNSCKYTCLSWYTWDWSSCSFAPYLDFKNVLVSMCWISETEFDNNFNSTNWTYNWNIDCSWAWLTDSDLANFNELREVLWELNISNNNLTNLNWLSQIWRIAWNFDASNNSLTDIWGLNSVWTLVRVDLSNNNLTNLNWLNASDLSYVDVSNNNLSDISKITDKWSIVDVDISDNNISDISWFEWKSSLESLDASWNSVNDLTVFNRGLSSLRTLDLSDNSVVDLSWLQSLNIDNLYLHNNSSLQDLSVLNNYTYAWKTISLDDKVYSIRMKNLSSVCNTWTILDQNLAWYGDITNICKEASGSFTNFEWNDTWDWSVTYIWSRNKNWPAYGWYYSTGYTKSWNTWPSWSYDGNTYLFVEASDNNKWFSNKSSALIYNVTDDSNYINFYYHMYWANMWDVSVYARDASNNVLNWWNPLYTINGQQHSYYTSSWTKTPDIDLPSNTAFIVINYVSGYNYQWDFSIDAITVWEK